MIGTRGHISRWLRRAQWSAALLAVLIATSVVWSHHRDRATIAAAAREGNLLKLSAAKDHIENYVRHIQMTLRFISLEDSVARMTRDSRHYIQAIFEANYEQHQLSEIYVIERDFDGASRPFMTLELGDEQHGMEELHTIEREEEEYAVQVAQIRLFDDNPDLEALISEPVALCVGEPGVVFSTPIRSKKGLEGIVAGMVPLSKISATLQRSSVESTVFLATAQGSLLTSDGFPDDLRSWFRDRFREETVGGFFDRRETFFSVGSYLAIWTPAKLPGAQRWYAVLLYDEAALLRAGGVAGALAGWATAGVVLLLGAAVVFLCRVGLALHAARHEAQTRADALGESEARIRAIVDTAGDGIIIIDQRGIVESFNPAAQRIFGCSADEVVGRNVAMLMPQTEAEQHDEHVHRYLSTRKANIIGTTREIVGLHKDGTEVPIELTVTEIRQGEHTLFTGIVRDITERRLAEAKLRRSEERFRAIADYTYDWEHWVGPDGKLLWINRAVERITGYTVEECMTMPAYPWPLIFPDDREMMGEVFHQAVVERSSGNDVRFRMLHKKGSIIWGTISWQPIFSSDGACLGHRSSISDITDRVRAEEQAGQRQTQLAHVTRLATMGEMATGLAHELNQPLGAIVNYIYAASNHLRSNNVNDDQLREDLESAMRQAHRAGEIIDHLREFVRNRKPQRILVDINALVREVTHFVGSEMRLNGVQVRCDLASPLPHVLADSIQIEQVMVNLIRNGREAMIDTKQDDRRMFIRTLANGSDSVEVAIADTGRGLADENLRRVFEPYFSTKPDGMGMGLSISRSIIEGHGGRLWAAANTGRGLTFRFTLPIERGETADDA